MAFSMRQIKVDASKNLKVNPKSIFKWLSSCDNISINAKQILNIYISRRLNLGGLNNLTLEGYKYLIKDLLKNCCKKEFIDITPNDTEMYLKDIAFQLKWALKRHIVDKRTLMRKSIYESELKFDLNKKLDNTPPAKLVSKKITKTELLEYMSEVIWL